MTFYALKGREGGRKGWRDGGRGGQRIVSSHKTWETVTSQKEAPDPILQVLLQEKCKTYLNADNRENHLGCFFKLCFLKSYRMKNSNEK